MKHFKLSVALFCIFFSLQNQASNKNESIPTNIIEIGLSEFKINGENILAINFKNYAHWHTYWLNPGDSGLPIKSSFSMAGEKIDVTQLEAPIPDRMIEEGDIWANGHDGEYTYFYKLPNSVAGTVELETTWLICKHICLPGKMQATFTWPWNGTFKINQVTNLSKNPSQEELRKRFEKLPKSITENKKAEISFKLVKSSNVDTPLLLYFQFNSPNGKVPKKRNIFTPYPNLPFNYTHEYITYDQAGNFKVAIPVEWDGEYQDPPIALPSDGKFSQIQNFDFLFTDPATSEVSRVQFNTSSFAMTGEEEITPIIKGSAATTVTTEANKTSTSTLFFLLMAFIGGLILNIMPCVLPVISLKLFKLSKAQGEGNQALRRHNLLYTAGVLFSFLVLALIILAFKTLGTQVGWGFQLQSPTFVFIMVIVLFIFSLNLFGLFEFSTPGGRYLGNVKIKEGTLGDFFGGVLAVILSTPCSAPFLGTALTFAFSAQPVIILLTFFFIGLGLSFPFWIAAVFPKLIFFLPKPGLWMENVKKFLGIILLLTMAWLMDVYGALIPPGTSLARLIVILIFTFFAFYFSSTMAKKKFWKVVFILLPLFLSAELIYNLAKTPETAQNSKMKGFDVKLPGNLDWEHWSEESMQKYAKEGRTVFMDFTAKWCLTCKVNEKLVLDTSAFKQLVEEKKLVLLLADWTRYDPVIGDWLKGQGYVGVPAYFIQRADGTLVKLGETITISKIKENL